MVAILGGLDTLVFTGGIGEHSPLVRAAVSTAIGYLGATLDGDANSRGDRVISSASSSVAVLVIPTDENQMIARHMLTALLEKFPAEG
jgi:acetate kinase